VRVLRRLVALAAGFVLLIGASGCTSAAAGAPRTGHAPDNVERLPAEYAGGACQLMNFDLVKGSLGVDFDVAGAGNVDDTYTCVLQKVDATLHDLTLAVTPTMADTGLFHDKVIPKGATVLSDLGKLGYSRTVGPSGGAGPGAEVGWLSGNQRLMVLRYRSPAGTAATDVTSLVPRLVDLAKRVDQASV
jgi:hypothetical protein